jgi:hypothetical protein
MHLRDFLFFAQVFAGGIPEVLILLSCNVTQRRQTNLCWPMQ